jgi:hypothetical protein
VTTLHLLIACVTVLTTVFLVVRALGARDERRAQVQRETAMHDRAGWATADELRARRASADRRGSGSA